jgi:Glycosyl transferase 4-like domain
MKWHVLTGEYPPQRGGVSTYTKQVARGLAELGDSVVIWAPPAKDDVDEAGIEVRRLPDCFGRASLRVLGGVLDGDPTPHRLLVQYVPHAFGWKGANLPLCAWVAARSREAVWVMFHEVGFPFSVRQAPWHNALAAVNRVMARQIAGSAERVFVSIPGWRPMVERFVRRGTPIEWLPVPSGIRAVSDPVASAAIRARIAAGRALVGHFGTHGAATASLVVDAALLLLRRIDAHLLLIGPDGERVRQEIAARDTAAAARVHCTGELPEDAVSIHLSACDLMLQPYPDGISTRRTSAMASLAHGLAVVTTAGWLTEPLWHDTNAVALAPAGHADALANAAADLIASCDAREQLARRGRALYDARFDVRHTIAALSGRSSAVRRECA